MTRHEVKGNAWGHVYFEVAASFSSLINVPRLHVQNFQSVHGCIYGITSSIPEHTRANASEQQHPLRCLQSELKLLGNEEQARELSGGYEAIEKALVRSKSLLALGRCRKWQERKKQNEMLHVEAKNGGDEPESKESTAP